MLMQRASFSCPRFARRTRQLTGALLLHRIELLFMVHSQITTKHMRPVTAAPKQR